MRDAAERLAETLIADFKVFLHDNSIDYHKIEFRIKKIESFLEKIERKKYENPFTDIKDICGIRIICYNTSQIVKISNYIENQYKDDGLDDGLETELREGSEDINEMIIKHLRRKKSEEAYHAWIKKLQEKYIIEINKEKWKKMTSS